MPPDSRNLRQGFFFLQRERLSERNPPKTKRGACPATFCRALRFDFLNHGIPSSDQSRIDGPGLNKTGSDTRSVIFKIRVSKSEKLEPFLRLFYGHIVEERRVLFSNCARRKLPVAGLIQCRFPLIGSYLKNR
jgi:hypothetical protein